MGLQKYSARLCRAITVAACAHRDQFRKGSQIPYFTHPFSVAMLLDRYNCPEPWVIAGLLHDTLEDTPLTAHDLHREFGEEITEIVIGCTEPDHHRKPWLERKQHTISYLKTASLPVKVVSCADKLHNLLTIANDLPRMGDDLWARFKAGRDLQEWYYRNIAASLVENLTRRDYRDIFQHFCDLVDRVFLTRKSI